MIGSRLPSLCVLGFVAVGSTFAAPEPGQRDLAAEVKAVFQAKCAQCHGPQVRKPKGKFGYVLDLKKLAADPDKVVPGKPADSQLWQLVQDEEMPPEEARAGPLTQEQKQIIHDWIAAGAPSVSSEPPAAPTPTTPSAGRVPTRSAEERFLRWLDEAGHRRGALRKRCPGPPRTPPSSRSPRPKNVRTLRMRGHAGYGADGVTVPGMAHTGRFKNPRVPAAGGPGLTDRSLEAIGKAANLGCVLPRVPPPAGGRIPDDSINWRCRAVGQRLPSTRRAP